MHECFERGLGRCVGVSFGVFMVFGLLGIVTNVPCAYAQELNAKPNSALGEQCIDQAKSQRLGRQVIKDDPQRCGHTRMLSEGNNVFAVYQLHADKKLKLVEDSFAKAKTKKDENEFRGLLEKYKKDGTCFEVDINPPGTDPAKNNGPQKYQNASERCLERLRRQAADADLQARKEILRQNSSKTELITDKNAKNIEVLPSEGGSYDRVTKDFYEAVKEVPLKQDPKTKAMQLLAAPQAVDFGDEHGEALRNPELDRVKMIDAAAINPDVPIAQDDVSRSFEASMVDGEDDVALAKKLKEKQKQISQGLAEDDNAYKRNKAAFKPRKDVINAGQSVSAEALKAVMNDITSAAAEQVKKADSKAKLAPGAEAQRDIRIAIMPGKSNTDGSKGSNPNKPKAVSIDDMATDHLDPL